MPKIDTILLDGNDLPQLLAQPRETTRKTLVAMLLEGGVKRVAIKGSGGSASLLYQAGGMDSAPWFAVQVVDTIGAGDAFAAGHIHGRVTGLSGPECCRLANAYGAIAVTGKGAGRAMPALETVLAFMASS